MSVTMTKNDAGEWVEVTPAERPVPVVPDVDVDVSSAEALVKHAFNEGTRRLHVAEESVLDPDMEAVPAIRRQLRERRGAIAHARSEVYMAANLLDNCLRHSKPWLQTFDALRRIRAKVDDARTAELLDGVASVMDLAPNGFVNIVARAADGIEFDREKVCALPMLGQLAAERRADLDAACARLRAALEHAERLLG